ncbi:hypothetical protein Bca52824_038980 [Brassica carinata]|uniref:DUF7755 domain-containing protein n=1 Tax=Brassica carinata TaxID=52824 RepID=A0A8X7UXP8_BRACI|nr:hypothetical protein Bca52824_038980 [Brassica carinata]
MATESICLNPLSFARLTKNPSSQFRKRRNLSCRIRRSQSGSICSKTSDYQGQWRVGGASLWVVKGPVLGEETNVEEAYCYYRYDFEVGDILLGESSDLSMVELRPSLVSNEESMEEYANLKLSLLLYDALLILLGSSVFSFSLGEHSAIAFFSGGTVGFLYLLLLQRSVDELQAPGSSSSS